VIAATVERVLAVPPSALLKRLWRLVAVLRACHQACEPLERLLPWMHQMAPLLNAEPGGEAAPSAVVAFGRGLQQRCPHAAWLRVVASVETSTLAFMPQLFEFIKPPLWPRTTHDLERFSGRLTKSRRHATGRKHTPALILREGRLVAILFGLPPTDTWVDACSGVDPNDVQQTLRLLRHTDKRRKGWHARHDLQAYLASLEQPWVAQE
jgi:hypothetical protein